MSVETEVMRPQAFHSFTLPRPAEIRPDIFVHRSEAPKELLAGEADTQGWDTASAVRLSQVNEALERTGVSPPRFNAAVTSNWSIDGTFGPWRMTRGGSGSIVFLKTPIPAATMSFAGTTTTITGASATIQVKLKYLPQPEGEVPSNPSAGDKNNLSGDAQSRSEDDPAVVVQRIDYGSSKIDAMEKALFQSAIAAWYNQNLGQFTYVFAVVALNRVSDSPQFQWLAPTYTSYAYYDGSSTDPSEDAAYFGALTMNGRDPVGLANQLPASAIPAGQGAAMLIGMRLYMENMVLPGVQAAFPGSSVTDFKIGNANTSVQLARNLDMEKIKVGLVWYQPTAEDFTLQVIGDEIQTRSKIHVPISPGIDAYVLTESYYRIQLVTKDDGTQTIGWVESRPAKRDHYYTKETWVVITEVIVGIIGAVATFAAGKILTGVLRVVVMIIIIVIAGLAAATPELIARAISDGAAKALPSMKTMLTELLTPIEWPTTTGFTLMRAELNGSLQLSGNFTTST
ncbi:TULIP family P47-like protein [Arthrobacter sp. ERGS1:01]|uniref:TULIP family P47-like protein n=1 Tax=Arthrobacter sp. ERGS1:01 TaxID=1704044 RepID=UPI0009EAE994|nr:TULIP family P47-like protein [Arthrobacter sp. ERGS1:01]